MRLALILSDYGERMRELQRNLSGEFSVIIGRSVAESLDLLQTLPVDVVLVDLDADAARGDELPERIREIRPQCTVVGVLPPDGDCEGAGRSCDASLRADSTPYEISMALAGVLERQRLQEELEQQRAEIRRLQARSEKLQAARPAAQPVDKILKAFSRALSSGFDQERLLNLFADTVLEMMRVSKVSVLLQDPNAGAYRVRCYRGLRPDVAEGLCLRSASGLAAWLGREGRIMSRELADGPGALNEVRKEMDALQATVSIPMLCSGMLVGVLNLNARVTGSPFQDDELETLFTMASHMAVALQDVGILSQMQHQKAYIEQILEHLSAGVVTINEQEQVVTLNQRAGEILGRAPSDTLRRDLRRLPSPLGDLLYETMRTGQRYQAEEILLLPARVSLLVNTYRLEGPDGRVLGSAAVFDRPRPRREPNDGDGRGDRLALLQPGLEQLATDISEPAAYIQEFADRLAADDTRDSDSRASARTLQMQARRLQAAVEKLAAFAGRREYRLETRVWKEVVEQGLAKARAQGLSEEAARLSGHDSVLQTNVLVDIGQFTRALCCLFTHAAQAADGKSPVLISIVAPKRNGKPSALDAAGVSVRYCRRGSLLDTTTPPPDGDGLSEAEGSREQGLDLMVGRRIVEDHGGTLAIESNLKGEVCILVELPAAAVESQTLVMASN